MVERRRGIVIAIDGPAGAGKSTVSRLLAARLGFCLLDSGALYRVMALHLMRHGIVANGTPVPDYALASLRLRIEPGVATMRLFLDSEDVTEGIRQELVGIAASVFSARPEVRGALLDLQRSAARQFDLVAEGRDMGTVVFPDADLKFFLTADLHERARRRHQELLERGKPSDLDTVTRDMLARDHRDESREESPLRKAPDAIGIETTLLSQDEVIEQIILNIQEKLVGEGFRIKNLCQSQTFSCHRRH